MARAEGVADDQGELGDDAVADGVDELRPAADDPRPLGVAADVEAVDVLDEQQRDPRSGCSRARTARPCRRCRRRSRRRTGTGRPPRAGTGAAGWPRSPAGMPPSRANPQTSVWPYSARYSSKPAAVDQRREQVAARRTAPRGRCGRSRTGPRRAAAGGSIAAPSATGLGSGGSRPISRRSRARQESSSGSW